MDLTSWFLDRGKSTNQPNGVPDSLNPGQSKTYTLTVPANSPATAILFSAGSEQQNAIIGLTINGISAKNELGGASLIIMGSKDKRSKRTSNPVIQDVHITFSMIVENQGKKPIKCLLMAKPY